MAAFPTSDREFVVQARQWAGAVRTGWRAPLLLVILLGAAVWFEWVYSPVERALGTFMLWSQPTRPQAGRGWDLNREGSAALDTLSRLADRTRQRRTAGATLERWDEIPAILDSFQVFSISPERFLTLYDQLPNALQRNLIDPIELLRARGSGDWRRVFFAKERNRYQLYLVSADNFVLNQSELSRAFFERCRTLITPVETTLAALNRFPLVMNAENFFDSLAPDGPVELESDDIRWISNLEGELKYVGLELKPDDDLWQLAFEVIRAGTSRVYFYWVTEESGRRLAREVRDNMPGGEVGL